MAPLTRSARKAQENQQSDNESRSDTKSSQSRNKSPKSSNTFAQFARLPADVRQEIWGIASSSPASTPGVCILELEDKEPYGCAPLVVHEPYNPALLATNTEAHDIASKSRPAPRDFDPAKGDILYIPDGNMCDRLQISAQYDKGSVAERCIGTIRHLAIPIALATSPYAVGRALRFLGSLETISVVYPQPPGPSGEKVNCFADVEAEAGIPLRLLTADELADITVVADYTYQTWHSDLQIKWKMNGKEHLDSLAGNLNHEARPGNGQPDPAMWDPKTKKLKLKYEGRVFAPQTAKAFHKL
ncbi:hypothetical protein B0H63DRAFT_489356 [Podospora didyma]|uniref:2EXR domain-containing protein n=1 Tax=Podospora didyma TaxID=330526 RepID=A0AAE0K026_9PEZI|nr:hypothetical protein B0H63DRAFT_489356 [Podospora didyma]